MRKRKIETFVATAIFALTLTASPVMAAPSASYTFADASGQQIRYTATDIDYKSTGSITIYKYEDNEGVMTEGDGQYHSLDNLNQTLNLSDAQKLRPMSGIQFTATKIAEISKADQEGENVSLYYNVSNDFLALAKTYQVQIPTKEMTADGKKINACTAVDIENAVRQLNASAAVSGSTKPGEAALIEYGKAHADHVFAGTDADGKTTAELPLGLYLITETDSRPDAVLEENKGNASVEGDNTQNHQDVENPASPYLVSLPMTNLVQVDTWKAGTLWQYDIVIYPKNQTTSVTKKIVSPDPKDKQKLVDYEDYDIGDTVKQIIYTDIPANLDLNYKDLGYESLEKMEQAVADGTASERAIKEARPFTTYAVTDQMETGLKYSGVTRVSLIPYIPTPTTATDFETSASSEEGQKVDLTEGKDYVVIEKPITAQEDGSFTVPAGNTPKDTAFTVQLTKEGLDRLNTRSDRTRSRLVVYYDSVLTPMAKIGTDSKNTDQATLTWKHSNTEIFTKKSNEARVFTYELDLTKTTSGGNSEFKASKSSFTVKQAPHEGDGYAVKQNYLAQSYKGNADQDEQNPALAGNILSETTAADKSDVGCVLFIKDGDGVYHVYTKTIDDLKQAVTRISPSDSGKLQIRGLDSAEYTLTEKSTEGFNNLFSKVLTVNLAKKTGIEDNTQPGGGNGYSVQEAEEKGTLAANGLAEEHCTGELDANQTKVQVDSGQSTSLDLGGTYNQEQPYTGASAKGQNKGAASLILLNEKTITLRAGGSGRQKLYLTCCVLGILLVMYAVASDRRIS